MVRVRLGLRTAEAHSEAGVLSFLLPQASGCTRCLHLFQALGEAPVRMDVPGERRAKQCCEQIRGDVVMEPKGPRQGVLQSHQRVPVHGLSFRDKC